MTIDEAIKHCEEVAEKNESEANFGFGNVCIDRSSCLECAKEHRQLATWLKELKAYKEQQPSEDCISRKAAIDGLASIAKAKAKSDAQKSLMGRVMFFTEHLPSVTPQPKTGHWIEHKHGGIEHIECSKCKCWFLRKDLIRNSYCPNCGSRNHWEWELKMQEAQG